MPLTLVAASYDPVGVVLTLGFSRAVDVSGLVPASLVVTDGNLGVEMGGTAEVFQPDPATLEVVMIENGPFAGAGVTLTASAGNGIVAADDAAAWVGVVGLELPFP